MDSNLSFILTDNTVNKMLKELGKVDFIWWSRISISHWRGGDGNAAPYGQGNKFHQRTAGCHPQETPPSTMLSLQNCTDPMPF